MKKRIIIGIVAIVIIVIGLIIISFKVFGTPEERREAEEMKRKAENAALTLKEFEDLEEETNKKINYIVKNWGY